MSGDGSRLIRRWTRRFGITSYVSRCYGFESFGVSYQLDERDGGDYGQQTERYRKDAVPGLCFQPFRLCPRVFEREIGENAGQQKADGIERQQLIRKVANVLDALHDFEQTEKREAHSDLHRGLIHHVSENVVVDARSLIFHLQGKRFSASRTLFRFDRAEVSTIGAGGQTAFLL